MTYACAGVLPGATGPAPARAVPPSGSTIMPQQATDCRVYERRPCHLPTSCQPAAAQETRWAATIVDLSQGGVRLSLRRRFERGACLAIELPGRDGEDPYTA